MGYAIRHVQDGDHHAVHQIFLSPHVVTGTMRLPIQRLDETRKRLEPSDGTTAMVALAQDQIVGFAELYTFGHVPRHRHAGDVNMIVTHADWQGKGVARALMEAILDLADNWLQLSRLGLTVWTTNERAVALYESLGFEVEGTLRAYAYRRGAYVDAHVMARLTGTAAG